MLRLIKQFLLDAIATMSLLRAALWFFIVQPRGFGKIQQISEEGNGMAKVFTYLATILAVNRVGVEKQRVVVSVDGVDQEPLILSTEEQQIQFKVGPVGALVRLTLDYLDEAGNDSDNAVSEFVVADQIAPEGPGNDRFGPISQIAEEELIDEPAPDEPAPEPAPDEPAPPVE